MIPNPLLTLVKQALLRAGEEGREPRPMPSRPDEPLLPRIDLPEPRPMPDPGQRERLFEFPSFDVPPPELPPTRTGPLFDPNVPLDPSQVEDRRTGSVPMPGPRPEPPPPWQPWNRDEYERRLAEWEDQFRRWMWWERSQQQAGIPWDTRRER